MLCRSWRSTTSPSQSYISACHSLGNQKETQTFLSNYGSKIYTNEHLTKQNAAIARKARILHKHKKIESTWTRNCRVFIKFSQDGEHSTVTNLDELKKKLLTYTMARYEKQIIYIICLMFVIILVFISVKLLYRLSQCSLFNCMRWWRLIGCELFHRKHVRWKEMRFSQNLPGIFRMWENMFCHWWTLPQSAGDSNVDKLLWTLFVG